MHQKVPKKNAWHRERRAFRKRELFESESNLRYIIHTVRCTHIRDSSMDLYTHGAYLYVPGNTRSQYRTLSTPQKAHLHPFPINKAHNQHEQNNHYCGFCTIVFGSEFYINGLILGALFSGEHIMWGIHPRYSLLLYCWAVCRPCQHVIIMKNIRHT